jgi:hypothetical protein
MWTARFGVEISIAGNAGLICDHWCRTDPDARMRMPD